MTIELEKEEYIILPMFAHEGEKSLDAIATAFYGKPYCGQQTGEMINNDTYHVYDFTGDLLGWYPEEEYSEELQRWLDLKLGDPNPSIYSPHDVYHYDFEIEREAPTPSYIMADLIRKGQLPVGKYLVRVSW